MYAGNKSSSARTVSRQSKPKPSAGFPNRFGGISTATITGLLQVAQQLVEECRLKGRTLMEERLKRCTFRRAAILREGSRRCFYATFQNCSVRKPMAFPG